MTRSASCSRGSPRGYSACSNAAVSIPATPTYSRPIPLSKNLPLWPASAAPRSRDESHSVRARARAYGAWGLIPTRPGCSRPPPGTRISRASIYTPTSRCQQRTARAWNSSAAICSARRAKDRLRLLDDGRIALTLKTAWADGTRQLVFEPLELLEKLAALTPRPRINLVLYHGVLAPHSGWRARVVAYDAPPVQAPAAASASADANDAPPAAPPSRHWAWAELMRRAFDIDVLACPRCGGRLRLIATVEAPDAVRAILATLALSEEGADRASPFAPSLSTSHIAASGA